jgi:dihydroorotase-like cyclic amidohydrolase
MPMKLCFLALTASLFTAVAAANDTTCIDNGRVFRGESFETGTLRMREGGFVHAGEISGQNVDRIDADGLYLLPPFAEAHTHTFFGGERSKQTSDSLLEQGVFTALSANNPNAVADAYREWHPGGDSGRKAKVDVVFANGGFTTREGHPVLLYRRIHTQ